MDFAGISKRLIRPIYGYRRNGMEMEIEPAEAVVVKMIFLMTALGYSKNVVAEVLNRQGYTDRKEKPISYIFVRNILYDERYLGTEVYPSMLPEKPLSIQAQKILDADIKKYEYEKLIDQRGEGNGIK